jgi:hypothetical protein
MSEQSDAVLCGLRQSWDCPRGASAAMRLKASEARVDKGRRCRDSPRRVIEAASSYA